MKVKNKVQDDSVLHLHSTQTRWSISNKDYHKKPKKFLFFFLFLVMMFIIMLSSPAVCQVDDNQENATVAGISENQQVPIYIADFYEPGCHDCERAEQLLNQISFEYPQIEIKIIDISTPEGVTLAEQLGEMYNVPEYDRLLVPVIYIGDDYYIRNDITWGIF